MACHFFGKPYKFVPAIYYFFWPATLVTLIFCYWWNCIMFWFSVVIFCCWWNRILFSWQLRHWALLVHLCCYQNMYLPAEALSKVSTTGAWTSKTSECDIGKYLFSGRDFIPSIHTIKVGLLPRHLCRLSTSPCCESRTSLSFFPISTDKWPSSFVAVGSRLYPTTLNKIDHSYL